MAKTTDPITDAFGTYAGDVTNITDPVKRLITRELEQHGSIALGIFRRGELQTYWIDTALAKGNGALKEMADDLAECLRREIVRCEDCEGDLRKMDTAATAAHFIVWGQVFDRLDVLLKASIGEQELYNYKTARKA